MKILFVSHDANRAGAQIFLLNIMRYFQQKHLSMHLLLMGDGALEKDFEQVCQVSRYPSVAGNSPTGIAKRIIKKLNIGSLNQREVAIETLKTDLLREEFDCIYTNTIATAWVMPELLAYLKLPLITHIHELEFSLQLYSSAKDRKFLFENTTKLIACSQAVADNLIANHGVASEKVEVIHSFVDNQDVLRRSSVVDRKSIKAQYDIPENAFIVGGCGNAEWRKGLDVFVQLASQVKNLGVADIHFVWVGVRKEGEYYEQVRFDMTRMAIENNISLIEPTPQAVELINCFDIFAIVSREDPFPLVMLEAALAKRTIFGFERTGGCSEFIEHDAGRLFPYLDIASMAAGIVDFHTNPSAECGKKAQEKVLNLYSFENSVLKISKLLENLS